MDGPRRTVTMQGGERTRHYLACARIQLYIVWWPSLLCRAFRLSSVQWSGLPKKYLMAVISCILFHDPGFFSARA